jgi:hypothetical protein
MEVSPVKLLFGVAMVTALVGCASYEPVRERTFSDLVAQGCGDAEERTIVTGYVSRAYENTVVLWDGIDPQATVAVTVPGRNPWQRLRGALGKNKHEVTQETLNRLTQERVPVTVTLECQGNAAPLVRHVTYNDENGQRIAIAY